MVLPSLGPARFREPRRTQYVLTPQRRHARQGCWPLRNSHTTRPVRSSSTTAGSSRQLASFVSTAGPDHTEASDSSATLICWHGQSGSRIPGGWASADPQPRTHARVTATRLIIPALREHGERVRRAQLAKPFATTLAELRTPPWWSPVSNPLVDGLANTGEFFIHHEDARRGQDGWAPRELTADHAMALVGQIDDGAAVTARHRQRPAHSAQHDAAPAGRAVEGSGGHDACRRRPGTSSTASC